MPPCSTLHAAMVSEFGGLDHRFLRMLTSLRPTDNNECRDDGLAVPSPVPLSSLPPPALLTLVLPNSILSRTSSSRDDARYCRYYTPCWPWAVKTFLSLVGARSSCRCRCQSLNVCPVQSWLFGDDTTMLPECANDTATSAAHARLRLLRNVMYCIGS